MRIDLIIDLILALKKHQHEQVQILFELYQIIK